jgi:putative transposase
MIDRGAKVSVKRQAELLDLSRSSVYYTPRPLSERDLMLMRRIDELHLELPFYGSRIATSHLRTLAVDWRVFGVTNRSRRSLECCSV